MFSILAKQDKTPAGYSKSDTHSLDITPCQILTTSSQPTPAQILTPATASVAAALAATTTSTALTVLLTPVPSTPIIPPALTVEETGIKAAWNVLMDDISWRIVEEKEIWKSRIGAHDHDSLEFIEDSEIDELATLLTPIPFRRFKKFMNN